LLTRTCHSQLRGHLSWLRWTRRSELPAEPLSERAGRKPLSAEDLIDFALETGIFSPVAIFGVDACEYAILNGEGVREALTESYRA
jgi:hypothetical protein